MRPKPIKGANMLSLSPAIGFGSICARRDFWPIGNQSYKHEEIGHFTSFRGSYKVDLPGEYGVSATIHSDLTLFDVGDDSRSNPFEERGDDEDQPNIKRNYANDPLEVPLGPITRARTKKLKEGIEWACT